jgi:hypothetical protein
MVLAGPPQGKLSAMLIALMIPICLASYGLAVLIGFFGPAYSLADFYRGGDDWHPILDDGREASRRVAGYSMIVLAVSFTLWFFEAGLA